MGDAPHNPAPIGHLNYKIVKIGPKYDPDVVAIVEEKQACSCGGGFSPVCAKIF